MFHLTPFASKKYNVIHLLAPRTVLEQQMNRFSGLIRSKVNWRTKYKIPNLINRWREEMRKQRLPPAAIDYVIDELQYYDAIMDDKDKIEMSPVDGVWQSDTLLTPELCDEVLHHIKELERGSVPDWHPGSNNQVLDLVHPSLYCNHVLQEKKNSPNYQWIPSEVFVTSDTAEFKSRINNLDDVKHSKLYDVLNRIFYTVSLPLLKCVSLDWNVDQKKGEKVGYEGDKCFSNASYPVRIQPDAPDTWYEYPVRDEEDEDDEDDAYDNRTLKPLQVPKFDLRATLHRRQNAKKTNEFKFDQLQVIVKIATIVLTPESPTYPGGVWHIEGTELENIFCSQICYLESENISESRLSFRCAVGEPAYAQSDDKGILVIYGLENDESLINNMGSVLTVGKRCIAFPNLFQHKVEPFQLLDPSKCGHRRILVFFIVNPDVRIPSTATLEPKQISLYRDRMIPECLKNSFIIDPLWDMIIQYSGDHIWTLEEAREHRVKLMHERKFIQSKQNEVFFEREFSLCEH